MTGPVPPIGAPQHMQSNGASLSPYLQPGSAHAAPLSFSAPPQPQLVARYPAIGGPPGPQIMMIPQSTTTAYTYQGSAPTYGTPPTTAYASAYQGSPQLQPMVMMPQSSTLQYPGAGCKPPPQTARARPLSAAISLSYPTLSPLSLDDSFIKPAIHTLFVPSFLANFILPAPTLAFY